jgi:hypothetical protein
MGKEQHPCLAVRQAASPSSASKVCRRSLTVPREALLAVTGRTEGVKIQEREAWRPATAVGQGLTSRTLDFGRSHDLPNGPCHKTTVRCPRRQPGFRNTQIQRSSVVAACNVWRCRQSSSMSEGHTSQFAQRLQTAQCTPPPTPCFTTHTSSHPQQPLGKPRSLGRRREVY